MRGITSRLTPGQSDSISDIANGAVRRSTARCTCSVLLSQLLIPQPDVARAAGWLHYETFSARRAGIARNTLEQGEHIGALNRL